MNYSKRQIFYINSRNRVTGTDENFTYVLDIDPLEDYDKVVLLSCSIPKSYYIVRDGYNTFTLKEGVQEVTISVDVGNYNRTSLKNKLISLLNTNSPNGWVYNVSYNSISNNVDDGKYLFTVTGNTSQPEFIFNNKMYEQLGFNKDSTNVFVGDQLKSTNVINLTPETTLYIKSNICQNRNNMILQDIITSVNPSYSNIVFNCPSILEYSKNFVKSKSNFYTFSLYNEDNEIMNLNGINIVMTIMIYKTSQIDDLIKGYIKYKTIKE